MVYKNGHSIISTNPSDALFYLLIGLNGQYGERETFCSMIQYVEETAKAMCWLHSETVF